MRKDFFFRVHYLRLGINLKFCLFRKTKRRKASLKKKKEVAVIPGKKQLLEIKRELSE